MKKILLLLLGMFMISFTGAGLTDDITSYYKLDGISGPVIDELGINNGVNNGATRNVIGKLSKAFSFDGITDYVNTTFSKNITSTSSLSISFWFKTSDTDANDILYGVIKEAGTHDPRFVVRMNSNSSGGIGYQIGGDDGTVVNNDVAGSFNDGVFHFATFILTTTSQDLYIDNTLVANSTTNTGDISLSGEDIFLGALNLRGSATDFINATIDEVGIWNKTLNASEISELWNNQNGNTYPFIGNDVSISLNSPDNQSLLSSNVTFNVSVTPPSNFNLSNATLFVWFENGTLFNTTTNILLGNETNTTTFIVDGFSSGNFIWNVFGVASNTTSVIGNFSDDNNTFTWVPFSIDNEEFNINVFETSKQDFLLNISTLSSVLSADAILNYNGTRFTSETSCLLGLCEISTSIDIPLVSSGQNENKTFFWEISIFDGTNSFSTNISSNEQNVSRLNLEKCNATFTVQTLNFTSFDESNQNTIDPFMFDGDFNFWIGTGTIKRNNSISESSISSLQLCMIPINETLFLDGTIEYNEASGDNYTTRNYFFQNDTINNVSQDIKLGLLLSEDSTSFILKVQDRDILPVANVLIFTQRFYPGEGIFKTVQVSETDDSGRTVGFFETETVDYRFILKQNGETVLITNKQKIVGEEVPFTLTFTIGEDAGSAWENFEDLDDLSFSLLFDKSSNIVSFTYADTSEDFTSSRLIVSRVQYNSSSNIDVCDITSSQSSAILSCNLTGNLTGTYIARALITRESETSLIEQIQFQIEDFTSAAGRLGLLLGFFLILISAFMFKYNEIAGIIMVDLAIIATNMMGLIAWGYTFISAIVAISIIILVLLER